MKNIGIKIKELRTERKLTQNELATALNITQDSISLWEKGKRIPDTQYVVLLAMYFDVSADYLLGLEDETGAKTYAQNSYYNNGTHNGDVNFGK